MAKGTNLHFHVLKAVVVEESFDIYTVQYHTEIVFRDFSPVILV